MLAADRAKRDARASEGSDRSDVNHLTQAQNHMNEAKRLTDKASYHTNKAQEHLAQVNRLVYVQQSYMAL